MLGIDSEGLSPDRAEALLSFLKERERTEQRRHGELLWAIFKAAGVKDIKPEDFMPADELKEDDKEKEKAQDEVLAALLTGWAARVNGRQAL